MNFRRPLLIVFLTLFFCFGAYGQDSEIQQISAKLTTNLTSEARKSVAVVDFTDLSGCVTELGRYVAEELSTDLASQGASFQVVDRTSLQVIMQENKLASTGVIDPSVARKLGQIAGVDTLVSGTLVPFGDSVHVSVKALDATTARILASAQSDFARTPGINDLLARSAGGCSVPINATKEAPLTPAVQDMATMPSNTPPEIWASNGNLRISVRQCRVDGEQIMCAGKISYLGHGTTTLALLADNGSLIDDQGGHFSRTDAWFGSILGSRGHRVEAPSNVPISCVFVYGGYTPGTKVVNLIFPNDIVLRNVPLTR
jgi:TolB-like protein